MKIVLTGAAGGLGTQLRPALAPLGTLVSTDIVPSIADVLPTETYVQADLADFDAMGEVIKGADMVVHFGAIVDEKPFEELLGPNFVGSYNVWENAYRHGVRRVVYASSIHAVGMYDTNAGVDLNASHRPDTFYGLAKCFSEDLGRMYWDKRGLESVHLRIASCTAKPGNARALGTWLSYEDCVRLVLGAVQAQVVGFSVIYGVSANDRGPFVNTGSGHLGFVPQDNAAQWAQDILAASPPADPQDLGLTKIGGPFAVVDLGQSGMAAMPKVKT